MNLSASFIAAFAALYTQGSIPKWFTILLWCLSGLNLVLFLFSKI